jgi:hypothetical protein
VGYGFGFLGSVVLSLGTAIVKLHPAKATVIKFAPTEPRKKIPQASFHTIDMVPFPEFHQTSSTTAGTTTLVTKPVAETRNTFLPMALWTPINCQVAEALPKSSMGPLHSPTALPAVAHSDTVYL